jgi:hypothetical protein
MERTIRFPAFRSDEWIQQIIAEQWCPPEVLKGVDLTTAYMAANPSAAIYVKKADETKEQMKRALFRHSLFKVQNIEVTSDCRSDRILRSIGPNMGGSFSRDFVDKLTNPDSTKKIHEEIWEVERCGSVHEYAVRFYREGDDGFSTKVFPLNWKDKYAMFKFYFS